MNKKLKIMLNILPCVAMAFLCIMSFIPISIKGTFSIISYIPGAPFFFILGILLNPIYIAIINCINFVRGKYVKTFLDMNLVLIITNLIIALMFWLLCGVRTSFFPAVNLLTAVILYDFIMLKLAFAVVFLIKYMSKNFGEKKPVRGILKILPIPFLLLIAMLIQMFALPAICTSVNNSLSLKTVEVMKEIPLPEDTGYIETVTFTGRVSGTGDGTDLFSAMLIKSELSEDELVRYYSAYDYGTEQGKYYVTKQTGQKIEKVYSADVYLVHELKENEDYYLIYVYGKTIPPFSWFDIRGV